ncbi:hypothetical protein Trydic_g5985 [Trypoxylus dichotomus]
MFLYSTYALGISMRCYPFSSRIVSNINFLATIEVFATEKLENKFNILEELYQVMMTYRRPGALYVGCSFEEEVTPNYERVMENWTWTVTLEDTNLFILFIKVLLTASPMSLHV